MRLCAGLRESPVWPQLASLACAHNCFAAMDASLTLLPAATRLDLSSNNITAVQVPLCSAVDAQSICPAGVGVGATACGTSPQGMVAAAGQLACEWLHALPNAV